MLNRLLSHDLPRSRWLAALLLVVVLGLAVTPFLFPGTKALNVAAKIIVFIVLVASFDLHDEDDDLRRHIQRLGAREQERRDGDRKSVV